MIIINVTHLSRVGKKIQTKNNINILYTYQILETVQQVSIEVHVL